MQCKYCNNILSSKYTLKRHISESINCLSKQKELGLNLQKQKEIKKSAKLKSSLVHKQLQHEIELATEKHAMLELKILELTIANKSTKFELDAHILKQIEYEQKLDELKKENSDYRDRMFLLASKPNHITKTINNIQNITISDWHPKTIERQVADHFNLEHVKDGINGVVRFTVEHITKPGSYLCTDSARETFMYKDEDGVVRKDLKATKLKNAVKGPIQLKAHNLWQEEHNRLNETETIQDSYFLQSYLFEKHREIKNIDDNNSYSKGMALMTS